MSFVIHGAIHGAGQDSPPVGKDMYLGEAPPGKEAKIFAPGIVSTKEHNEFCCTFSADGKEFYFNRGMIIMVSRLKGKGKGWTKPAPVTFTEGYDSHEPHITLDNKRLFYGSMRPRPGFPGEKQPYGIWMTERTPQGWGKPVYVGYAMYVTTTRTGVIYATDVRGASNREQGIAKTTLKNGGFAPLVRQKGGPAAPAPERLPGRHPCISADERFIIFDAYEKKTGGDGKLFVSFREGENQWGPAILLGDNVNKCEGHIAASLSPDGKYLFYCCSGDIYWVDIQVIDQLRPKQ